MPDVVIIAGPNGAGKTTFATEYLSAEDRRLEFVNADEIAREWAQQGEAASLSDVRAGRMMLDRIDELVKVGANFAIETTLASLSYARKIPQWRRRGYKVTLVYLRLPSVAESIARVRRRMEAGATASRRKRSGGALTKAPPISKASTSRLSTCGIFGKARKVASFSWIHGSANEPKTRCDEDRGGPQTGRAEGALRDSRGAIRKISGQKRPTTGTRRAANERTRSQ